MTPPHTHNWDMFKGVKNKKQKQNRKKQEAKEPQKQKQREIRLIYRKF